MKSFAYFDKSICYMQNNYIVLIQLKISYWPFCMKGIWKLNYISNRMIVLTIDGWEGRAIGKCRNWTDVDVFVNRIVIVFFKIAKYTF